METRYQKPKSVPFPKKPSEANGSKKFCDCRCDEDSLVVTEPSLDPFTVSSSLRSCLTSCRSLEAVLSRSV